QHIAPPYVLVGQSFAGIYNRIFAQMYPNEVAGMVLLDPTTEQFVAYMEAHHPEESASSMKTEDWPEGAGILPTLEELGASGAPPDIPVIVVTGGKGHNNKKFEEIAPIWTQAHEDLARSFPRGRHVITDKSGHGIHVEQPQLVVDLIREVVEQARR